MKKLKQWIENKIAQLTSIMLNDKEWAENQQEINDIIALKNRMQQRINARNNCLMCMAEGAKCQCGEHL